MVHSDDRQERFHLPTGIKGSPTWLINGRHKLGGARPADQIQEQICKYNPQFSGCEMNRKE